MKTKTTPELFTIPMLRDIEARAEAEGVDLMEVAALATADWISTRYGLGSSIWIAVGVGNNGGDALFAAKILHERGYRVTAIVLKTPVSAATQRALLECQRLGVVCVSSLDELKTFTETPDLIVDGLLGIGINRAPSEELAQFIAFLNQVNAPILALDVPSGLDAETGCALGAVIVANDTLTFLGQKSGLWTADGADKAGIVHLARLGFHEDEPIQSLGALNDVHAAARIKLTRPRNSHKGRFGSVAVMGGHVGMLGAALLAGRAALATGVGKVWLNVLDERLAVDVFAPELMIRGALGDLSAATALAVGPGLGQDEAAQAAFDFALAACKLMVIDADALNLLAVHEKFALAVRKNVGLAVLTPHPTEAARLLGCSTAQIQANRVQAATQIAEKFAQVVVLKGAGTVIAAPDGRYRINPTGGSALAVAGQGDVLSGVISALLAQGLSPFEAACFGVYLHGLVGDDYEAEMQGSVGLGASASGLRISRLLNVWLNNTK